MIRNAFMPTMNHEQGFPNRKRPVDLNLTPRRHETLYKPLYTVKMKYDKIYDWTYFMLIGM